MSQGPNWDGAPSTKTWLPGGKFFVAKCCLVEQIKRDGLRRWRKGHERSPYVVRDSTRHDARDMLTMLFVWKTVGLP